MYKLDFKKRMALEMARVIRNNNIMNHPLRQLFWECTLRCNMHCRHCGSDCKKIMEQKDMPKEDFLQGSSWTDSMVFLRMTES